MEKNKTMIVVYKDTRAEINKLKDSRNLNSYDKVISMLLDFHTKHKEDK